jgi:carboxylesterase
MMDGPWELDAGGERGVLCLHGFTGTPYEVRPLGDALAARGITAVGPRLPGHESVDALARTGWIDWLNAVEAELAALRRRCRRVAVAGLSLGGLLALSLARRHPDLGALAVLATPLWLPPAVAVAIRALALVTRARLTSIPKSGADIRDAAARRVFPTLGAMPLASLRSLLDLATRVRAELPQVRVPALVMHGDGDHVAPPACAGEIYRRIGSAPADKRLVRLPRSFHIITVDVEHETVAREVGDFIEKRLA